MSNFRSCPTSSPIKAWIDQIQWHRKSGSPSIEHILQGSTFSSAGFTHISTPKPHLKADTLYFSFTTQYQTATGKRIHHHPPYTVFPASHAVCSPSSKTLPSLFNNFWPRTGGLSFPVNQVLMHKRALVVPLQDLWKMFFLEDASILILMPDEGTPSRRFSFSKIQG